MDFNVTNEENKINEEVKFNADGAQASANANPANANSASSALPTKVSIWTKLKDFLLQDVSKMELELTPRQQKFFDFWEQDVTVDKVYNFLFKEIKFRK